jgi:hypothetical protein
MLHYRRYAECRIMPNHSIGVARMSLWSFAMRHNADDRRRPSIIKAFAINR